MPEPDDAARLPLDALPAAVLERLRLLAGLTGGRAWLVGGPVRDALLGRPLLDLDCVVEGDAVAIAAQLPARLLKTTLFGTAAVEWPDGTVWDLAGARAEHYPQPGSLPVCRPAPLDDDLERRDFGINALAASLAPETWGVIVDPHGGLADLAQGVIRVLHEQSFRDDPTRLFRAARYAARLGFSLQPHTLFLARQAIQSRFVDTLTPARVLHELERSLGESPGLPQIQAIADLELWDAIAPGLEPDEARLRRLDALLGTNDEPFGWATRLAGLLPPTQPVAVARRLVARLLPPRPVSEIWERVAERLEQGPWPVEARPSEVVAELDRMPAAALAALAAHWPTLQNAVQSYRSRWQAVRPELDGHELRALGVADGPWTGALLRRLRDARLDGLVMDKAGEIALVVRWLEERDAHER